MDLLYYTPSSEVMVSLGSRDLPSKWEKKGFFSNYVLSPSEDSNCRQANTSDPISFPNSNAFIDLNGDCLPEIVLTRQTAMPTTMSTNKSVNTYYEIYSQVFDAQGNSKYCLAAQDGQLVDPTDVRTGNAGSSKMPFIEFSDFNRDGMIDMAFTSETGIFTILYNQFSAPGPKSTNLCSDVGNTSDLKNRKIFPTFPFDAEQNGVTQVKLSTVNAGTTFLGLTDSMPQTSGASEPAIPGRPRVCDIDMDGYPDIVMTLNFKNSTKEFS